MTKTTRRLILTLAVLLGTAASVCAAGDGTLTERRAARRADLRTAFTDPAKSGPLFRLLVIPVDFADHRLPADWDAARDLAPRVAGLGGETLERYFAVASDRPDLLRVTLASLIHLTETSAYYSDRYAPQSVERTRALAAEAIAGADAAGLDFALADADADGIVDGVLILHAAPGLENDPVDGWVVPLQFYLEAPYRQGAYEAQSYAVASLRSGPGVWCHETGHLLGLEDRYDTALSTAGDAAISRGGLGAASLMAAGAWGRGDGTGAALPDAYSLVQLGWVETVELTPGYGGTVILGPRQVLRVPASATDPGEYFLLHRRGGLVDPPYDATYPDPRIEILHVDETVPDDARSPDEPTHLRVRLVEADGTDDVAAGGTPGGPDDLFAAPGVFGPYSAPPSDGYAGPSEARLEFVPRPGGLDVDFSLLGNPFDLDLRFVPAGGDVLCDATLTAPAALTDEISVILTKLDVDDFGLFAPGVTQVERDMTRLGDRTWVLSEPIVWEPGGSPGPGDASAFTVQVFRDGTRVATFSRTWLWSGDADPFSLAAPFATGWTEPTVESPTRWRAWSPAAAPGLPDIPLLACVAADYTDGTGWPDVSYANNGDARLISPSFAPPAGQVLRLIHATDLHAPKPGVGSDGARVACLTPDGGFAPLIPDGGYDGIVDSAALNDLHGQAAFIGSGGLRDDNAPLWRLDTFPFPSGLQGGTRLEFRLASDPLWRGRGWLIARLDLVPATDARFAATWDSGREGVALSWPWETPTWVSVDASLDNGASWTTVWEGGVPTGQTPDDMLIPAAQLSLPDAAAGERVLVRGRIRIDLGEIVSRHGVLGTPASPPMFSLGAPRPNPSAGEVAVDVLTDAPGARLSAYDARGRRVRSWWLPNGAYLLTWDGRDDEGRRLPAGLYLLRMSVPDGAATSTRKVTLLR